MCIFKASLLYLCTICGAMAHVTMHPDGPHEFSTRAYFQVRVPHGCEESPTTSVQVKLPPGAFRSMNPEVVPGFEVNVINRELDPSEYYEHHGHLFTETAEVITWTAKTEDDHIDADQFRSFGFSARLGCGGHELWNGLNVIWMPTIQQCASGETHNWITIPAEGQAWGALDEPAPYIHAFVGEEASVACPDINATEISSANDQFEVDLAELTARLDKVEELVNSIQIRDDAEATEAESNGVDSTALNVGLTAAGAAMVMVM
eukprot:Clim_evm102s225 gene=Clim_evmTU102s225